MPDSIAGTPEDASEADTAAATEPNGPSAGRRFLYREAAPCPIDGAGPPAHAEPPIEGAPQTGSVRPPPAGCYGGRPFLPTPDPTPLPDVIAAAAAAMTEEMMARLRDGGAAWDGHRLIRQTRAARYASLGSKDELAAVSADTT